MEQWEWWIGTVLVLFGAISGVSWQIGKVAKDSEDRISKFAKETSDQFKHINREVGVLQQELRDHCKSNTVPCPYHEDLKSHVNHTSLRLEAHLERPIQHHDLEVQSM